jgi:hypothetical protein
MNSRQCSNQTYLPTVTRESVVFRASCRVIYGQVLLTQLGTAQVDVTKEQFHVPTAVRLTSTDTLASGNVKKLYAPPLFSDNVI